MTKHRALGALLAGVLLTPGLSAPGAAQSIPINETRPLRPGATVELKAATHNLRVESWNRDEIRITGAYESGTEEVEIHGTESALSFEISYPGSRGMRSRRASTELRVRIPADVQLLVRTLSGDIYVRGVTNSIEAGSASGDVTVTGNAVRVGLSTLSGRLRYEGDSPWVQLSGASGPLVYIGAAVNLQTNSVSGNTIVEGQVESLELHSMSGSIRACLFEPVRSLRMNTVSGSLGFTGALAQSARVSVESLSGSVDLSLEPGTEATFEVRTLTGRIQINLPVVGEVLRARGRYTLGAPMRFMTGAGSAQVKVSSVSGSVRIRSVEE